MASSSLPTTPGDTQERSEADAQYYRTTLHSLIDMAQAMAQAIHAQAMAQVIHDQATLQAVEERSALPPQRTHPAPDLTVPFDRIARLIRRTILLARHVAAPAIPKPRSASARAKLIRSVEDAIHRKRHDHDTEALTREFHERLENPELELDLQGRTVDELIEEISRDLGVAQQGRPYVWKRRTPEDIKTLQTRAAAAVARRSIPEIRDS